MRVQDRLAPVVEADGARVRVLPDNLAQNLLEPLDLHMPAGARHVLGVATRTGGALEVAGVHDLDIVMGDWFHQCSDSRLILPAPKGARRRSRGCLSARRRPAPPGPRS